MTKTAAGGSTKILLLGARLVRNLGGPSLLMATREVLDTALGDTEYTFLSPTLEDIPLSSSYGMTIYAAPTAKMLVKAALLYRLSRLQSGTIAVRKALTAYCQSDVIVDIWGIGYSDALGRDSLRRRAPQGFWLLAGKILGKKVIKYTADLGPFERRWNRLFSYLYFKYAVDLIFARSESTKQRLTELKISTPIHVLPDTAFLLGSESSAISEEIAAWKGDRPLVGLSVSHMAARQSGQGKRYEHVMAKVADAIHNDTKARILLIANEVSDIEAEDDIAVAERVLRGMASQTDGLVAPTRFCTATQLKGVINHCDAIIAARYHTIVAGLSQGIPVLAIGWHAKYEAVMGLFDLEEYVFPVDKLDIGDLLKAFRLLWDGREAISSAIIQRLPIVQGMVRKGGDLVKQLLRSSD